MFSKEEALQLKKNFGQHLEMSIQENGCFIIQKLKM